MSKPMVTYIVLFILITTLLNVPGRAIPVTTRLDGFSDNLLTDLTDGSILSSAHSVYRLSSGDLLVAGIITLPANLSAHPNITNDADLVSLDSASEERTSSLLVRLSGNATLVWAVRTVLCAPSARFFVTADESINTIFVVGSTTGAYNDTMFTETETAAILATTEPDNRQTVYAGAVAIQFTLDGTRTALLVHDELGATYFKAFTLMGDPDVFVAIGYCPAASVVFSGKASGPRRGGICGTLLRKQDLSLVQHRGISRADEREPGSIIEFDKYLDSTASFDGLTAFVAVDRLKMTTDGIMSMRSVVFAVDTEYLLATTQPLVLPDELQLHVNLAELPQGDIVVAYISRLRNREEIVARRLTRVLRDSVWAGTGASEFRHEIERDEMYRRTAPSVLNAACSISDGSFALAVYTQEIVDKGGFNADRLAALSNSRVAIVALDSSAKIVWISQTWREEQWEPLACVPFQFGTWSVVGVNHGPAKSQTLVSDHALLAFASRPSSSIRTMTPTPTFETPRATPIPTATSKSSSSSDECIGASSLLKGQPIGEIITTDKRFRVQKHELRHIRRAYRTLKKRMMPFSDVHTQENVHLANMFCTEWDNGTSRLCATPFHVIRSQGHLVYMRDACLHLDCYETHDIAINFKGHCGDEIIMYTDLNVTMHTGSADIMASEAARRECALQKWSRTIWLLTTL